MGSNENNILAEVNQVVLECRKDPKVDEWEKNAIRDFASRVSIVLTELENFKMEGESLPNPGPFNPEFRKKFNQIFSSFLGIPTTFAKGMRLGVTAISYFQLLWTKALDTLGTVIESEQQKIGIESWGLSLGVGFPIGVTGTISVTFKPAS